ncbi:MAG: hypothetical protein CMJ62_08155 [Planctomycetaceae bacterium]|nr:hypothetical protein [Planctomycetaceae bacterium]
MSKHLVIDRKWNGWNLDRPGSSSDERDACQSLEPGEVNSSEGYPHFSYTTGYSQWPAAKDQKGLLLTMTPTLGRTVFLTVVPEPGSESLREKKNGHQESAVL